ncbi:hypothetical protein Tco_1535997, partial [Tanacetum coccineum]
CYKKDAEKLQPEEPKETEDASASHPPSPKSIQIQELTNQVLLLQSQNSKLKKEKIKAEVEVAFLSAQPTYLNVEHLTKLLVKSLSPELSKLLSSHDFSSSLPTELKELPSKFNDLTGEIKDQVSNVQSKIKTLDAIPILLNKLTEALDRFAQAEGEKNTRQVTITHLFKQRTEKDVEKANLNKQPIPTTTQTTTVIPLIIPTTLQLQSPFLSSSSKSSPQPEGELIKKDKGKKAMSSKDAEEEGTKSDSDDVNLTGSKVESSKKRN